MHHAPSQHMLGRPLIAHRPHLYQQIMYLVIYAYVYAEVCNRLPLIAHWPRLHQGSQYLYVEKYTEVCNGLPLIAHCPHQYKHMMYSAFYVYIASGAWLTRPWLHINHSPIQQGL